MKPILAAVVLTMLLVLSACGGSQTQAPAAGGGAAPGQPVVTTEGGTVAENPTVRTAPAASYPAKIQELLDKSQKVKSYSFYYVDSAVQLQSDVWFVKGNKAMLKLYEPNYWNRDEWIDTVYLDLSARTAVGYCENWQQIRCTDNNRPFQLVFTPFEKKQPAYWLTLIPPAAQVVGGETIDERFVTKVQWTDGDMTYSVWLDNTFGLPMKVWIDSGSGKPMEYYYKDIAFNVVKDEVLSHQFVKRG